MENVNDLPIEVLTRIFDYFDVRDRRHVSAVCTLWRDILHSVRFQRQCRTFLDGRFEEEFTESEKVVLQSCRNLSIILWDEDNESDYDYELEDDAEGREKEEIIPLTYLFNPTPQQNITDLIFSQKLDLERLDINSTFVSCREILQDRLEKLENLKELSLLFDFRPVSSSQQVDPQVWSIRHNRIETLQIGLLDDIQPITLIAPNLTTLDLKPKCPWILDIIRSYKHQLQSLKIDFQNVESMSTLMMMDFPCLTHLNVQMLDDKDNQIRYARTRNRFVDEEIEERFIKGMPKLKQLLLTSNLMLFRIAKALAKYAYQLEEISLEEQQMEYELLKVVERIPKLRRLTMLRCEVMDLGQVHPTLSLPPCLSELELLHSKSNLVFNKGLAGLKSLNVCSWTSKNHKMFHKICKNLPNLEHLTVAFNSPKLENTALRHLHRLTKLKTLTMTSMELKVLHWKHCSVVPSVQRLTFENCTLQQSMFRPIVGLFPSLKELYLDRCDFKYCDNDNDSDNDDSEDRDNKSVEQLREMFPLCRVSFRKWLPI